MVSSDDAAFRDLMAQVLAGSETAARQLFQKYEPHLLLEIRRKLNKKIRSKFDSQDFAQDVWASFFAEPAQHRIFESPEELLSYLTKLARHKIVETLRQRLRCQKYDVNREERSMDDSHAFDKQMLPGPAPTPSYIVAREDEWHNFISQQPPVYRRIFVLLRAGKSQREIASEMGIDATVINRVIHTLIEEWAELQQGRPEANQKT